jgi:hypothetical protein
MRFDTIQQHYEHQRAPAIDHGPDGKQRRS